MMRALSLTQPWATLVAIGAKQVETRSWATGYRGLLAIHAAKGLGPAGGESGLMRTLYRQPFNNVFVEALQSKALPYLDYPLQETFAYGAIVAVCRIVDCRIIGRELNGDATIASDDCVSFMPILGNERAFGDYSPGRYAWLLAAVRPLPEPIPTKGKQRLWTPDAATVAAVEVQLSASV